jgi:predicted transcriptional regulator
MRGEWRLLSSQGEVLLYLVQHPEATVREISAAVELSQRQVDLIVRQLHQQGILQITRVGRRNSYQVSDQAMFRHPSLVDVHLTDILRTFTPSDRCR